MNKIGVILFPLFAIEGAIKKILLAEVGNAGLVRRLPPARW